MLLTNHILCNTEDLYTNPTETVQRFCDHIGIEFEPEHLHWSALGSDFDIHKEWLEAKNKDLTDHWHGTALRSTGFALPATYEVDFEGHPTFAEIDDLEHRTLYKQIYLDQLKYYEAIRAYHSTHLKKCSR